MKYRNTIRAIILLCFLSICLGTLVTAQIKVGVGKADITPSLGTPSSGYYIERLATNVHDELFARALVLEDGKKTLVLVVVDNIDVAPYGFKEARKRIQQEFNIPTSNIVISETHTHTGPILSQDYEEILAVKIHDAFDYGAYEVEVSEIAKGEGERLVESSVRLLKKINE